MLNNLFPFRKNEYRDIDSKRDDVNKFTIVISMVLSAVFSAVFLTAGMFPMNLAFILFTFIHFCTAVIHKTYPRTAKIVVYISLLIQVFVMSILLGPHSNTKVFYIPIVIIPFIIFSKEERIYLKISILLSVLNIVSIYAIDYFQIIRIVQLPLFASEVICSAFNLASILTMMLLAWLFLSLTEVGETLLLQKSTELSEQKMDLAEKNETLEKNKTEQIKLNKLKDKLLSIISHDIKTPVNNMHSVAELIIAGKLSGQEIKELAGKMKDSAGQTRQLLENLLTWSANQFSDHTPHLIAANVRSVADQVLDQLRYNADAKNISLLNLITEDCEAKADIQMLEIILRNLVNNAIKFSFQGQIVTVSSVITENSVWIRVEDRGTGISPDIMEKLFEPDISKSRLGTRSEKGTGIGLLLCKQLAELMNGSISAHSSPGEGTVFTLVLPSEMPLNTI